MSTMPGRSLESHAASAAGLGPARARLALLADGLVAAAAAALPWSGSVTEILIVLWLIVVAPTLGPPKVWRELMTAAGGLPVLLWLLGAFGMLWADVSWGERLAGLSGFHRLVLIPVLLAQFRRSGQAQWVILAFLASTTVLLIVSWVLALAPGLLWRGNMTPGVPVRDPNMLSAVFAICAFGLIYRAAELWHGQRRLALALLLGAALFIANIAYVTTARTTLVALAVLLVVLGLRQSGWRGALAAVLAGTVVAGALWAGSPHLRQRVSEAIENVQSYGTTEPITAVGLRLDFWSKSLDFIAAAPVIGHGTGTIPQLFQRTATPGIDPMRITQNPHNQILTVAIQLGVVGALVVVALWIAHLALFCGRSLIAWFGLVVVLQNIVGSVFNSYLFDSGQGWLYVIGVGVLGGTVLHASSPPASGRAP
jgi:O-antigen ligase